MKSRESVMWRGRRLVSTVAVSAGALGVLSGATLVAASPAQAAEAAATCQYTVLDNPTPVYYSNFSFYEFKYPGNVVAGPPVGETVIEGNGTVVNFDEVYLAVGGTGWINAAKVSPINSC